MKLLIYFLFPALLGALIGWVTNLLAIRLLFRPYHALNVFGLFQLQGLLPKRKSELALAIGQTIEQELLSSKEIFQYLQDTQIQEKFTLDIINTVQNRIEKYVPNIIPGLRTTIVGIINKSISREVEHYFQETFPETLHGIENLLPIAQLIEEKINQLDFRELELLVIAIADKELKHIEYLGGLLGFLIGLVQGLVFFLLLT